MSNKQRNRQQQQAAASKEAGATQMSTEQNEQKQELGEQSPPADVSKETPGTDGTSGEVKEPTPEDTLQDKDAPSDQEGLEPKDPTKETVEVKEDQLKDPLQETTKEQQELLDQEAEAQRLQAEADLANQAAQEAERLQLEQQQQDEAAAAELAAQESAIKPTGSSLFEVVDSPMSATLKTQLSAYVTVMNPKRVTTEAEINTQQLSLYRLLNTWLTLESSADFMAFGENLVEVVSKNRDEGCFNPRYVNRNIQEVRLQPKQRLMLTAVTNVLYSITNPDRKLGYTQAGNVQAQLSKVLSGDELLRAVIFVKRVCGVN